MELNRLPRTSRGRHPAVRKLTSWLWALSPLTGVLGPAPTWAVLAIWKRSRRYAALAAGSAAATITAFVLYETSAPGDSDPSSAIMFPLTFSSLILALRIRRRVFDLPKRDDEWTRPMITYPPAQPLPPQPQPQPALTRALQARTLREEARTLLATDPSLAEELGIGRP